MERRLSRRGHGRSRGHICVLLVGVADVKPRQSVTISPPRRPQNVRCSKHRLWSPPGFRSVVLSLRSGLFVGCRMGRGGRKRGQPRERFPAVNQANQGFGGCERLVRRVERSADGGQAGNPRTAAQLPAAARVQDPVRTREVRALVARSVTASDSLARPDPRAQPPGREPVRRRPRKAHDSSSTSSAGEDRRRRGGRQVTSYRSGT